MKTTKPLRIKKISVDFEFDEQYVEKINPAVGSYLVDVFNKLQIECLSGQMNCYQNCLFVFGTWSLGKEIRISQYNCAATRVTIENVWNEKHRWSRDKAVWANKILKEYPDTFIRDFAIGTIKIINTIKNDSRFREAKFKVIFHISYRGTGARSNDCSGLFYDSTDGFVCWD